jgi:putative ABC transport system permease protein
VNLYPEGDPIGKKIKIFGRNIEVIGVLTKEGEDFFGNSNDKVIFLPVNYFKSLVDIRDMDATIIVKAQPGISNDELRDELTGIMRSIRKLKPSAEENFSINETDIITKGFNSLFSVIATVGWIIGGFSLLVGGFGIANIMFVSVRERTNIIGIQKALGAKKFFILFQFLFEAIFLSLIGDPWFADHLDPDSHHIKHHFISPDPDPEQYFIRDRCSSPDRFDCRYCPRLFRLKTRSGGSDAYW